MPRLDDPDVVTREYATETGLLTRRRAYADSEGIDANDVLIEAIVEGPHVRVLEVGCGPGDLAERLRDEHGIAVKAIDTSERMVKLAKGRGVDARTADVQALPFDDESFDCVIAAWMLYHVEDLTRALEEIRRVLRPGGRLIAVTNSERHLLELWQLVGLDRYEASVHAEERPGDPRAALRGRRATRSRGDGAPRLLTVSPRGVMWLPRSRLLISRSAFRELDGPIRATRRNCILIAVKSSAA